MHPGDPGVNNGMAVEILKMAGVTKRFPGVLALNNVNFTLQEGETHALVGANGAGKSTLIKTLAGVYPPDSGTIELRGEKQVFKRPIDAKQKGIAVIYQEFTLFPDLDVAKNIYFGMEPVYGKTGLVNWKKVYSQAKKLIERFGLELNIYSKIKDLSIAQQQMVEIAKALACNANILVMDEPTATLTISEVERLFEIIEDLKKKNVSIIYISHRLDEVVRISNRLTVLRSGTVVGSAVTKEITKNEIVKMMVGENIHNDITPNPVVEQPVVMSVKNISNAFIHDISFDLKKGEVLGIAGLVGAGRTEVMRALFGADKIRSGEIIVGGAKRNINRPKDAINCKIGLLPESRKAQGLFMNLNIRRNITIVNLKKFIRGIFINKNKECQEAKKQIETLKIVTPSTEFPVLNLSGGNQQKVALGKWLCANCDILILDEPTRGVDVGAKEEIFQAVSDLAAQGKSVIFISSELEEVLRVSNRILTMYKGHITAQLDQKNADMNLIMQYITGGDSNEQLA